MAQAAAAIGSSRCFTRRVVDVNQIDVAGHVEFARAQLAHADDPKQDPLTPGLQGGAVQRVELRHGVVARLIQRQFRQGGHGMGDLVQGRPLFAIQHRQTFQHELPQDPQAVTQLWKR